MQSKLIQDHLTVEYSHQLEFILSPILEIADGEKKLLTTALIGGNFQRSDDIKNKLLNKGH